MRKAQEANSPHARSAETVGREAPHARQRSPSGLSVVAAYFRLGAEKSLDAFMIFVLYFVTQLEFTASRLLVERLFRGLSVACKRLALLYFTFTTFHRRNSTTPNGRELRSGHHERGSMSVAWKVLFVALAPSARRRRP